MALTKYDICTSSCIMVGAQPITSFDINGTAEQAACTSFWQPTLDNLLSLYPWRFASKTVLLARDATPPPPEWQASYTAPSGFKAIQAVGLNQSRTPAKFDRFENRIHIDASVTDQVWCTHTYEPPIAWWPGYFVATMEILLALRLAMPLSGKLDLKADLQKEFDVAMRTARHTDARQQTTRRIRTRGRGSIMEARLS